MASMKAKWQTQAEKGKVVARVEVEATASNVGKYIMVFDAPTNTINIKGGFSDNALVALKPDNMRLDMPKFDKVDPQCWIFNIHQMPKPQCLQIASFCLKGNASEWFR